MALRCKRNGAWVGLSYRELLDRVQAFSLGLRELDVAAGERVAILSENRPEWAVVDYACLAARCADVPIYPTLPAKQAEHILRDSDAIAVCASSQGQADKLLEICPHLAGLRHIIALDPGVRGEGVLSFDDVCARGRAAEGRYPDWREDALRASPDDLATLLYTSGTTGEPKGVMLTHGNIASNVAACVGALPLSETDECLSLLPLSHIFERTVGHYTMFHLGVTINYAESFETVAADMAAVRPMVAAAVPRLYEKIYGRVLDAALSGPPLRRRIFRWAKRVAEAAVDRELAGKAVPLALAAQRRIADRLVFTKVRARVGGRVRFLLSGGAPLSPDVARFFHAAGLPIFEGYGLTETSPVISINTYENVRLGTVGQPIPGVEVRIAPDGEILARGPNVMQGYFNKPEATAAVIDPDGWFHTGDIGTIDDKGFLAITDRKKDIIVTAGGKNIAPQPIENMAKSSPFVSNAVMLGDKRAFPVMLVVANLEKLRGWAAGKGLPATSDEALLRLPEAVAQMDREVRKQLRDLAQFETPKKILLLAGDFTIAGGELTPTLKVKRRAVARKYQQQIDALYGRTES